MANQFLTAQEYSNVMLLLLKNQLVMGRLVDGQFKNEVSDENGLTINVKRPPRFIDKKDGTAVLSTQDIVTGSAPVKVDQYSKVHIEIGDIEYVSSFDALMRNATMRSAASTLAHSIDGYLIGLTTKFHSWVAGGDANDPDPADNASDGTVAISSAVQAMAGHTRLMEMGVPNESLSGIVNFTDGQKIRGSLQTNQTPSLNVPALQRARIPIISEVDWYATQQLPILTTGTRTQGNGSNSGGQVDGAGQIVDYEDVKGKAGDGQMIQELDVDGLGSNATVKAGEVFTIQNVYAWDWRAQQKTEHLQQFRVVEDVTASSGGAATLKISPPIIVPNTGATQAKKDANSAFGTVDSAPSDDAYIKFVSDASKVNRIRSVFHKRAISLVSARLQMPFTGTASFAVDPDTGIAIRYWRGSDISTGKHIHRWDCLYGGDVLDPFLGTRLCGTT